MKKVTVYLSLLWLLFGYNVASAMSTKSYNIIENTLYSIFALGCFFIAFLIFFSLRGGSLGKPWLLIMLGFILATVGGAIQVLDLFKIMIHEYDLRLALLVINSCSIFFLFVGLFLYKKGLD
jgi:hypothetical protein